MTPSPDASDAVTDGGSTDRPTVSVVIPAYNAEAFVGDAIDSVLAQTFHDFEIIVVDDGSADGTRRVVTAYGDRVRFYQQEQAGASRARNRGIEEAHGEFIAFLDADDLWLPTKLEKQVQAFRNDPSLGLVTTCHEGFTPTRVNKGGHRKKEYLFSDDNLPRAIVVNSGLATPTVMVPRHVLDDVGVFDEDLAIAEDDNLWIRITCRYPAELVDEVLVRCRLREGSLSTNLDQLFDDVIRNLDRLMEEGPEIRDRIADGVPIRKSRIHWNRGYHAFARDDFRAARASFRQAIREDRGNRKAWLFLAVTSLPAPLVRTLRGLLRRLRGTEADG